MAQEQQDLIAASALIATDEFRDALSTLCDKLERRLDEITAGT